jgi:alkaline phosphatase D
MDAVGHQSYTQARSNHSSKKVARNRMAKITRRKFMQKGVSAALVAALGRWLWPHLASLYSGGFVITLWCGALTHNSVRFKARIDHASATVRMYLSYQPDLSDPFVSSFYTADASNNFIVSLSAVGLQPNTHYYYGVESDGVLDMSQIGHFKTPGTGAYSFSFAFASCAATASNHQVFAAINNADPLFFLHLGDMHYRNINQNDQNLFREAYNEVFTSPRQAALYRSRPIVYIWDDHDYGPDNSDGTSPSREAARLTYREYVPHYSLPAGDGDAAIYQAFTIGRVRFILTDLRSERSPQSAPDNEAKTMMGAAQKAWFKQELLAAKDNFPLIVWASSMPWIDSRTAGADTWGGYSTERRELADFIRDNQVPPILIISGDAHMVAIDDGRHSDYATGGGAAMPVFHGSSLDQGGSVKGGPYSHGTYPGRGHFGLVTVTDEGDIVKVRLSGRQAVGEGSKEIVGYSLQINHSFLPTILG